MPINTQLILISSQLIPNLTPLLDKNLRPAKVVMLVSDDMQSRGEVMEKILKPKGIQVERHRIVDPLDIHALSDQIVLILDAYQPGEIALNTSGGSKPMAIAAYDAFKSFGHPVFYVQDRLIWLYPKQNPQALAQNLKLAEYLYAYAADELIIHPHGVTAPIRTLTERLAAGYEYYAAALSALNSLADKANNPDLTTRLFDKSPTALAQLLDLFADANLCRISGQTLLFNDENARFIANGGWLELHAYAACLDLKVKLNLGDIAANITILRRGKRSDNVIKNEIDVALIKNNRLYLIECKTGGDTQKIADALYKLDSLRDLLGGLQAKAMLISFKPLTAADQARAEELKIGLCCGKHLQNLPRHLQNWLTE